MTKTYSIYGLIDPRDNKVFYIGKTSRTSGERYDEHIKETSGETPKQKNIQEIYEAKGLPPNLVVLEGGINSPKLAFAREVYWMEIFRMTGTVLTNASVDYDGVYFLTDDHLATVRKVGRWSVDISEEQLGDFELKEAHMTGADVESDQMQVIKSVEPVAPDASVRVKREGDSLLARKDSKVIGELMKGLDSGQCQGNVIGELMKGLESGRWQRDGAVLAATKLKELLEENGSWLPEFNGSNKLKKKKHERTLKVLGFLRLSEK